MNHHIAAATAKVSVSTRVVSHDFFSFITFLPLATLGPTPLRRIHCQSATCPSQPSCAYYQRQRRTLILPQPCQAYRSWLQRNWGHSHISLIHTALQSPIKLLTLTCSNLLVMITRFDYDWQTWQMADLQSWIVLEYIQYRCTGTVLIPPCRWLVLVS